MEYKVKKQKFDIISWAVYISALAIVLINLASLFFPSLIISTLVIGSEFEGNPYEPGIWMIPVLVVNLFLLVFGILYYKKILPVKIRNSVNFIFKFEVPRNVAIFVVVGILFFYIGFAVNDSVLDESKQMGDFEGVLRTVENWPFGEGGESKLNVLHVKNFFLKISLEVFQNIKIMPFIASISLLLLTYFFTYEISKKRFAGILAMLILAQSYTFLRFDTVATYANFWTLFYLLSLYLVIKKWHLSPVSYLASIFSKPITAAYLPLSMFFIFRSEIPKRKKILVTIPYLIIFVAILGIIFVGGPDLVTITDFRVIDFWNGFSTWGYQLRLDSLFLLFVLPVTVGLIFKSLQGLKMADALLVLIAGIIFVMPLMASITGYNLHPYRYIVLIVFFAVGVGTIFSNKTKKQVGIQNIHK